MAVVSTAHGGSEIRSWMQLSYWLKQSPRVLRLQSALLFVGVACFSAAMYLHGWHNTQSVVLMWVVAAFIAVTINTVSNHGAYEAAAAEDAFESANRYVLAIWQGGWAILTCGIMIAIVVVRGPSWTVIDAVVATAIVAGLIGMVVLQKRQPVWAKFSLFVLLKVVPQCCQGVLLLFKEAAQFWYPLVFAAISFAVGFLRLHISRTAYRKMPANRGFNEARSNVWSWALDMASFVFMTVCIVFVWFHGPITL